MSGDQYNIQDQYGYYFLTMTVVYWVDVFTRAEYRDVIVDSLNHCIEHKNLELNAWVVMSNHVHLVGRVNGGQGMSAFLRDFKKYTSKRILELIEELPESRRDWLLDKLSWEARRTKRAENYKLWKDIQTEDLNIIEGMQEGRNSPSYNGGNFSPIMDNPTHHFHKWVANNIV